MTETAIGKECMKCDNIVVGKIPVCKECYVCQDCGNPGFKGAMKKDDKAAIDWIYCKRHFFEKKQPERYGEMLRKIDEEAGWWPGQTGMTLSSLDENQKKIVEKFEHAEDRNLFIYGPVGTGKTHLAVAAAKKLMLDLHSVRFYSVPRLLMEIRMSMRKENFNELAFVEKMGKFDYLILDDMGAQKTTEWSVEILYLIIDERERRGGGGLIVTSNLQLDEIGQRVSERLASRIGHKAMIVKMGGRDRRRK